MKIEFPLNFITPKKGFVQTDSDDKAWAPATCRGANDRLVGPKMSLPAPCSQCAEQGERQRHLDDAIAASLAAVEQLQRDLDAVSLALRSSARAPEQSGAKTSRRQHESLPTWRSTSSGSERMRACR